MTNSCQTVDQRFPDEELVRIENGKLVIGKTKADDPPPEIEAIAALLKDRLEKIKLLDMVITVEKWLKR